ncbi:MAG: peptidoglycan editing factor PgeF [Bacillota bacterium]
MPGYSIKSAGDIRCISFDIFSNTGLVEHAFTTRQGGVSRGPYRSLNLAFNVGDDPGAVLENRRRISSVMGVNIRDMVAGQQVHGKSVRVVTESDRGRGAGDYGDGFPETDALVTDVPGVLLSSYYADCVPVMILDPVKKAAGLVHAGWKGTALRIAAAALEAMGEAFGTDPGTCLAAIAPSIGSCCYEVDIPLIDSFRERGFDPGPFLKTAGNGRWNLDLRRANLATLVEAGVRAMNITLTDLCTACSPELFFSYRGQSGQCGRMASLMVLK